MNKIKSLKIAGHYWTVNDDDEGNVITEIEKMYDHFLIMFKYKVLTEVFVGTSIYILEYFI